MFLIVCVCLWFIGLTRFTIKRAEVTLTTSYDYFQISTVYYYGNGWMLPSNMWLSLPKGSMVSSCQLTVWQLRVQTICTLSLCEMGSTLRKANSASNRRHMQLTGCNIHPHGHVHGSGQLFLKHIMMRMTINVQDCPANSQCKGPTLSW